MEKKERKVYEVPAMLVYRMKVRTRMLDGSGGGPGNQIGDEVEGARRFWIEDDDE